MITLLCWVIGSPTKQIFPVEIEPDKVWGHVKDAVKNKKKPEFDDIAGYSSPMVLWMVNIRSAQISCLESGDYLKSVTARGPLNPIDSLLATNPNDSYVNIVIVQRPSDSYATSPASITPSSFNSTLKRLRSNSYDDSGHPKRSRTVDGAWLIELHSKIWAQEDQRQKLFQTVEITAVNGL